MAFQDIFYSPRGNAAPNAPTRLGALLRGWLEAYGEWREYRDYDAIGAAFAKLSERQLNQLGMSRATLSIDLTDLMARADESRAHAAEIAALLDGRAPFAAAAPLRIAAQRSVVSTAP